MNIVIKLFPSNLLNKLFSFLGKRQKIIISSVLIFLAFLFVTQTANIVFRRYYFIAVIGVVAYLTSVWALWEGMNKTKALVLMILPTFFSIGAVSFYFLLPLWFRWAIRLPVAMVFGFSIYSLLLSQNVFNVAASRTIPLYRAASTVSFVFTIVTAFFLFNVIYALELPFYLNFIAIFIATLPLILQYLWTMDMGKVSSSTLAYSLILSLMTAEGALVLSFWPVAPTIWSIFLSATLYIILGVMSEFLRDRLTKRMIWEYSGVGVVVIVFSLLATSWTG